jgi:hypothetical protein
MELWISHAESHDTSSFKGSASTPQFERLESLFPLTMPTEEDYELELTCLIEGDPNTFIITLPRTAIVDELRRVVHKRGRLAAFRVRIAEVNLWKVCPEFHRIIDAIIDCLAHALVSQVDIDIESLEPDLSEFRLDDHKGISLRASDLCLLDLWPEQPPVQHLNVHARVVHGWVAEPLTLPNPFQECASCPPSLHRSLILPSSTLCKRLCSTSRPVPINRRKQCWDVQGGAR